MKTTIEISDTLFRRVKATAAERGMSLKDFFTEALTQQLKASQLRSVGADPAWMDAFGKLGHLRAENKRVMRAVEAEFEMIEPEDAQ